MVDYITTTEHNREELISCIADQIESNKTRDIANDAAEELAERSDGLRVRSGSIKITADTTEALKEVQDDTDISEERVREMQKDAGLSRLHPSRRQEFVSEILNDRVDEMADERLAGVKAQAREEAADVIAELFDREPETVTLEWAQKDSGEYTSHVSDEADLTVTISNASTDYEGIPGSHRLPSVVVLKDGSEVSIDSPLGEQTLTLNRGAYDISPKSIRELAREARLIEVDRREANCSSSDKDALNIEVGRGETNKAHVIELQNGDGGFSNRYVKGWTEYRDFDAGREMVLITVGQASYYRNSLRGKSERTWLVGRDDNQVWSQQVYNTHKTVDEAVDFMIPAEVQHKREEGREVFRQGDVFFVEMVQSSNFEAVEGTRHEVVRTEDGAVVTHPEHEDLELDGKWKAFISNDGSQSSSSSRQRVVRD